MRQYKAEKEAIRLINIMGALPIEQVHTFLKNKNTFKDFNPFEVMRQLERENIILFDYGDKCYKVAKGMQKDYAKVCAMAVYNEFAKSAEFRFSEAIYPFDYVFEDNNRLFQLINFSERGPYKLNFRRSMKDYSGEATYKIIPIIMLINMSMNALKERDSNGELYLLPKENFWVALVDYKDKGGQGCEVTVKKKLCKGGCLNEY